MGNASASETLPGRVIYRAGNVLQASRMKKAPIKLRPLEQTRLTNARALAAETGGITAMAGRLKKAQSQWQNTIGKTPTKRIGRDIAEEVETSYGLAPGELDREWPDGIPPSRRSVLGSAKAADDPVQFVVASMFSWMAASRPREAVEMAAGMRRRGDPGVLLDPFVSDILLTLESAAPGSARRRK